MIKNIHPIPSQLCSILTRLLPRSVSASFQSSDLELDASVFRPSDVDELYETRGNLLAGDL